MLLELAPLTLLARAGIRHSGGGPGCSPHGQSRARPAYFAVGRRRSPDTVAVSVSGFVPPGGEPTQPLQEVIHTCPRLRVLSARLPPP
jgi:hypothetical protein